MATVAIWSINSNLNKVIDYATDNDKTEKNQEFINDLHRTLDYVENDDKTEVGYYVTGINCSVKYASQEMMITKESFNKKDGIMGYHAYQSFKEGEVSPELAHKIGVQLAEEMWGEKYQVIVATHLNTKHFHNHFVINSVSFLDGKKCAYDRRSYAELRRLNDSICQEYGLSVLEEKPTRKKIYYSNYMDDGTKPKINSYTIARKDVDHAIEAAVSYKDFLCLLKAMNYTVIERYGRLTIRNVNNKKGIRLERSFGENYSIDRIKERIKTEHRKILSEDLISKKYSIDSRNKQKYHGLSGLYRYYCYLLNLYSNNVRKYRISPSMRLDVEKMEIISEETRMLVTNEIITEDDFNNHKLNLQLEIGNLIDEKNKIWYQFKTGKTNKEETLNEISKITNKIKPLRKELKLCNGIENRKDKIQENINEYEKEGKVYESIK